MTDPETTRLISPSILISKIILISLTTYTILGWPVVSEWDQIKDQFGIYYTLSFPHIIAYLSITTVFIGWYAILFKKSKKAYRTVLATTLSLCYTENIIFMVLFYVDALNSLPIKYLVREYKRSIVMNMALRGFPLVLLILEQKGTRFNDYKESIIGILSIYTIYATIICIFHPEIDGYIGELTDTAPTTYVILLFVGLAYATAVFDVYLTSLNRVNSIDRSAQVAGCYD
ncbi:hypothetical protein PAEPH01_0628 [Pancytospora epiphaga]|nr:hypothetical protein PAEPH01_0628 [Pancytospora epiphaga]